MVQYARLVLGFRTGNLVTLLHSIHQDAKTYLHVTWRFVVIVYAPCCEPATQPVDNVPTTDATKPGNAGHQLVTLWTAADDVNSRVEDRRSSPAYENLLDVLLY